MKSLVIALLPFVFGLGCAPLALEREGDASFRRALAAQLGGDDERAESEYLNVVRLGLRQSPVFNNLAVIAVHRHEYARGRRLLAQAVAANNSDVVALTNYGVMSYYLADLAEARRTLEGARRLRRELIARIPSNGRDEWQVDHYVKVTDVLDRTAAKYLDKIDRSEVSHEAPPSGDFVAELGEPGAPPRRL